MGLDMYLNGRVRPRYPLGDNPPEVMFEDYPVKSLTIELGYWRKHPDLHGYIVQNFDGGKDECQEIYLDIDNLEQIIQAVAEDNLPHTTGFFFGDSGSYWLDADGRMQTIDMLTKAKDFLAKMPKAPEEGYLSEHRYVVYQASW